MTRWRLDGWWLALLLGAMVIGDDAAPGAQTREEQQRMLDAADAAPPGTPPAAARPDPVVPPLVVPKPGGKPRPLTKLSKYDKSEYCDVAVDGSGTIHAVFTEQPDYNKPSYLYYRASTDGGAKWSEAKNLSDDESGMAVAYCRLISDADGRLYAIWKYTPRIELIDGPGGNSSGVLAYRCLQQGAWSRIVRLVDPKVPAYSWFAAPGPDGAVHVVWSQMAADGVQLQGWGSSDYANQVQQVPLNGAAPGPVQVVCGPPPLPTAARVAEAQAAGQPIPYEEQRPRKDGMLNLRGYLDAAGTVRFVAEDPGLAETGRRLVLWDGQARRPLYEYERYQTYNNFNNPPALLVDRQGREHLIRAPERSEVAAVRDYLIEDGQLGDPVNIVTAPDGEGKISSWQATQLPGGRMAVTVAMSLKGGYSADDTELFVSFSDGDGQWTEPLLVTDNKGRQNSAATRTPGDGAIVVINTYLPRLATVAVDSQGHPCLLMVNSERSLVGVNAGLGLGGYGGTVESPMVFFLRL